MLNYRIQTVQLAGSLVTVCRVYLGLFLPLSTIKNSFGPGLSLCFFSAFFLAENRLLQSGFTLQISVHSSIKGSGPSPKQSDIFINRLRG